LRSEEENGKVIALIPIDKLVELSQFLSKKGIIITHFLTRRKSLEKQFLDILKEQQ
jgi:hypothetical protein